MKIFPGLLVAAMTFISCHTFTCGPTKDEFISRFDSFVEKVDEADLETSDEEWARHDEKFRQFVEECYDMHEEEMTTRERRRFWIKSLKYYSTRYGEGMLNELSKDDDLSRKIEHNIEEVLEATGRDIEDFVNKNMSEIEDLVRDIGQDIEAWAEKLKEILEE